MALSYQATLDYLYSQLPMFTRIGAAAIKKDLTNTLALCNALNQPQEKFKSIHIAGTNGKGSTSHMMASILQEAGFKVGLYTSPHLKDFRERIRINGQMISEKEVVDFVDTHKALFEEIKPSFFEWTVALCFQHFAYHKVDIAIIETGLGGRLDSTNVIAPILSVISNIGWDHMDMLGDSLDKIAFEKAGIIKAKTPVVIGEALPETEPIFRKKSKAEKAEIIFAQKEYTMDYFSTTKNGVLCDVIKGNQMYFKNLDCDLGGIYQQKNIITLIAAIDILKEQGYPISENDIRSGLEHVKRNTGLMGRWQVLKEKPFTVCDTGHNVDGIKYVMEQLKSIPSSKLRMVFGMVKDKDISKVLALLPKEAKYYFCKANLPRALDEKEMQAQASVFGLMGNCYASVIEAYKAAQSESIDTDVVFVGGSTFVVAEIF
jgi:dihydrofolate synthase / folylpolyglutamate synthase